MIAKSLRVKVSKVSWSVSSRIQNENGEIRSVSLRIQSERVEIRTRKNSVFGHFSRSAYFSQKRSITGLTGF